MRQVDAVGGSDGYFGACNLLEVSQFEEFFDERCVSSVETFIAEQ